MVVRGLSGNFSGKEFEINGSLTFGRSSQGCNILFPDNVRGISRTHCKIEMSGSGAMITDLGSSYGTFVNGRKLAPYTPTPLNSGDTFWLGDKANSFSVAGTAQNTSSVRKSSQVKNNKSAGLSRKGKILAAVIAVAAVVCITAVLLIFKGSGKDSLVGTWKIAEEPGERLTFTEEGELIYTENGEFLINGSLTYSSAGDHKISVKYTYPASSTTVTGDLSAGAGGDISALKVIGINISGELGIGAGQTKNEELSEGEIWNYKYDKKNDVMEIFDVNGYKLFSLEAER